MIKRSLIIFIVLTATAQADSTQLTEEKGLEQLAEHYIDKIIPERFTVSLNSFATDAAT